MIKRIVDVTAAMLGLILTSPVLAVVGTVIWLQDFRSPFYVAPRVGRGGKLFRMVKFRSMVTKADRSEVDSTAADDPRITAVGRFIRRFKLDELPQLWNVALGAMSFVGPRPNVERETASYTEEENQLLQVRPGITDLASIVFADEGDILRGSKAPDLAYNQLIRPWKSRLSLLYVQAAGRPWLDLRILWLTVLSALNRTRALNGVAAIVERLGGSDELVRVARRAGPLRVAPPPGATEVVTNRTSVTTV